MKLRQLGLLGSALTCFALITGCSGSDGEDGARGPAGEPGATGATGPAGTQGAEGAEGPAGADAIASASISAVTPHMAFLDRNKVVSIAGFGTEWSASAAPTVSFGSDITVGEVSVASPTALLVPISVEADAELGPRDVQVTDGTTTMTFTAGFLVDSPLNLEMVGTTAQGSIVIANALGRDFETPFDTTYTGDGFFTPITYTNLQVSAIPGIMESINSAEPYKVEMMMFMDVDAAAGPKDFNILSGPAGHQVHFPLPGAFDLEARTATAFGVGTPATGKIAVPYGSALFEFEGSTTTAQLVTIETSATKAGAQPAFVLLPESGKFVDMIGYNNRSRVVTEMSGTSFYLVFWDSTGTFDYDFEIEATGMDIFLVEDTEPNNTPAQAGEADSIPFGMIGTLSSVTDEDWVKYEATAADVGKRFRMVTMPGDSACDTVVAAYGSDGTTLLGTESQNMDYHENHLSAEIPAAGTYYIRVSADQTGWYSPAYPNYVLLVTLE